MKRVGGRGDLTADIVGEDARGRSTIVQCKRYRPGSKVSSGEIQKFIGMKSVHHRADVGVYMTTAEYTKDAEALGRRHGLVMMTGEDIVKVARGSLTHETARDATARGPLCPGCRSPLYAGQQFCVQCRMRVS